MTKSIKNACSRQRKPPALPPSSPEVSRFEMNGKDNMPDGHTVPNGIEPHQNIEDHPKLIQADTVTGHSLTLNFLVSCLINVYLFL